MHLIRSIITVFLFIYSVTAYTSNNVQTFLLPVDMHTALNEGESPIDKLIEQGSQEEKAIDPDIEREYYLKAAFLRFMAKFIKWPESNKPSNEVNICIFGDVPSLKGINSINGRVIREQTLNVRRILNLKEGVQKEECHILFASQLVKNKYPDIIKSYTGLPVVTFGDLEGFAADGGCMNFYIVNNRMAIMINTETMTKGDLALQPEVLKLITIIPTSKDINFTS